MNNLYKNNIAIWYSDQDEEFNFSKRLTSSSETELHVNFWQLKKHNFLDIGLKIPPQIKYIYLYLHADEKSFEIKDLGSLLHKHEEVRNAVFNEMMNFKTCPKGIKGLNLLSKKEDKDSNNQICFNNDKDEQQPDKESNFENYFCVVDIPRPKIIPEENGSIICINLKDLNRCDIKHIKQYIRFRISGHFIDEIMTQEKIGKEEISYYVKEIKILDLRINNIRSLPDTIVHKMHKHTPNFTTIQSFFMAESTYDLSTTMKPIHNARLFEKDVWEKYLSELNEIEKETEIIAYQWKHTTEQNNKPKEDFILFLKISHPKKFSHYAIILFITYSIFTVLLSSICGKIILHPINKV